MDDAVRRSITVLRHHRFVRNRQHLYRTKYVGFPKTIYLQALISP